MCLTLSSKDDEIAYFAEKPDEIVAYKVFIIANISYGNNLTKALMSPYMREIINNSLYEDKEIFQTSRDAKIFNLPDNFVFHAYDQVSHGYHSFATEMGAVLCGKSLINFTNNHKVVVLPIIIKKKDSRVGYFMNVISYASTTYQLIPDIDIESKVVIGFINT